jgi:hypothetical protein
MNKRFRANQRMLLFVPGIRFSIVLVLCSTTIALPLIPKPNYGYIVLSSHVGNGDFFDKQEDIDNVSTGIIPKNNEDYIRNFRNFRNPVTIDNPEAGYSYFNFFNDSIIKGQGTFRLTLNTSTWRLTKGNSTESIFIDGDYILRSDGALAIKITRFAPESFEFLNMPKTAFLPGGTINFLIPGRSDIASEIAPGMSIVQQLLRTDGINGFGSQIRYDFPGSHLGLK